TCPAMRLSALRVSLLLLARLPRVPSVLSGALLRAKRLHELFVRQEDLRRIGLHHRASARYCVCGTCGDRGFAGEQMAYVILSTAQVTSRARAMASEMRLQRLDSASSWRRPPLVKR